MANPIAVSVKVQGAEELVKKLDPAFATEPAQNFLTRSAVIVQGKSREGAPVNRGRLRNSIAYEVDKSTPLPHYARVGTNVVYGPAMEFGRPAGAPMPPPGALLGWMKRKGIPTHEEFEGRSDTEGFGFGGSLYTPNEFALARKIARDGTEPHRFLTNGIAESQSDIDCLVTVFASELEAAATKGGA